MNEEIKEILIKDFNEILVKEFCTDWKEKRLYIELLVNSTPFTNLLYYITNLQQEIERLKIRNKKLENNQVRTLNKIRDYISMAKCEIIEGYYSNDKHSQYWSLFKEFAERLNKYLRNIMPDEYVAITKKREKELLDKEFKLRMTLQEIERLNNIINELEEDLDKQITFCTNEAETTTNDKYCSIALNYLKSLKNKLKELKEGK